MLIAKELRDGGLVSVADKGLGRVGGGMEAGFE